MSAPENMDDLRSALRRKLCNTCDQRSADEPFPPPESAICEPDCMVFANLPRLARVAKGGEPPCGYEVFAKGLQPFLGQANRLNIVHALTILETAQADRNQRSL